MLSRDRVYCRREILDHVIALNEQHLRRLIRDYASYHEQERIHDSLDAGSASRRARARHGRDRDLNAAPGRTAPPLLVAPGGTEPDPERRAIRYFLASLCFQFRGG